MKVFIFLIIILTGVIQKPCYNVVSNEGESIPYTTIKKKNKSEGLFADENGRFCYENLSIGDTLQFSAIGFQSLEKSFQELQDIDKIVMTEYIREFSEVVIRKRNLKTAVIGNYRGMRAVSNTYSPNSMLALAEFIENPENISGGILKKIKIGVDNRGNKFRLRFRFFKNTVKNLPDKDDLIFETITIDTNPNKKSVEVDLGKYNIPFEKDGIWCTVESIGKFDENNVFVPNKMGKFGKIVNTKRNPDKIDFINSLSPAFVYLKTKSTVPAYMKTWENRWILMYSKEKINYEMMLDLEVIY